MRAFLSKLAFGYFTLIMSGFLKRINLVSLYLGKLGIVLHHASHLWREEKLSLSQLALSISYELHLRVEFATLCSHSGLIWSRNFLIYKQRTLWEHAVSPWKGSRHVQSYSTQGKHISPSSTWTSSTRTNPALPHHRSALPRVSYLHVGTRQAFAPPCTKRIWWISKMRSVGIWFLASAMQDLPQGKASCIQL